MSASSGTRIQHAQYGGGVVLESNGGTIKVQFDSGMVTEVSSGSVSQILHS